MKTPHIPRNKLFSNGNISIAIPEKEICDVIHKGEESKQLVYAKALQILDTEFDTVPVTEEHELVGDGVLGLRLFSYRTIKEYFITDSDLQLLQQGKGVRLKAHEPSDKTFATMIWKV